MTNTKKHVKMPDSACRPLVDKFSFSLLNKYKYKHIGISIYLLVYLLLVYHTCLPVHWLLRTENLPLTPCAQCQKIALKMSTKGKDRQQWGWSVLWTSYMTNIVWASFNNYVHITCGIKHLAMHLQTPWNLYILHVTHRFKLQMYHGFPPTALR